VGLDEYVIPITAIVTMTLINVWIVTSVIGRAIDRVHTSLSARLDAQIAAARRPRPPGGEPEVGRS